MGVTIIYVGLMGINNYLGWIDGCNHCLGWRNVCNHYLGGFIGIIIIWFGFLVGLMGVTII